MNNLLLRYMDKALYRVKQRNTYRAKLGYGDAAKTLHVEDRSRNWVWARVAGIGDGGPREVVCTKIAPRYGATVWVELNLDGDLEVTEYQRVAGEAYTEGQGIPNVAPHNTTHTLYDVDPIRVHALQFSPLLTHPTEPAASLSVYVEPIVYWDAGGTLQEFAGGTIDLSSYVPTGANMQRLVMLVLDKSTNSITVLEGDEVVKLQGNLYYFPFTIEEIAEIAVGTDEEPSAVVRLYTGHVTIQQYDIKDMRRFLASTGSDGGGGSVGFAAMVADTGVATADTPIDTLTLTGGTAIVTSANSGTDTVTINHDITELTEETSIDGTADFVEVYDASAAAHRKVKPQNLPAGSIANTGTIVIKDANFTVQDDGDTTKQFRFQADGITAGQTRIGTLPDYDFTFATLAGTETLTNKTITGAVITGGTVDNTPIGTTTPAAGTFTTLQANTSALMIAGTAATVPLTIRMAASQSANPFIIQNSALATVVGIAPTGRMALGSAPGTDTWLGISPTITITSGADVGNNINLFSNPASASSAVIIAQSGTARVTAANAQNHTGVMAGQRGQFIHAGTGTVSTARAILTEFRNDSTGTITTGHGLLVPAPLNLGGGTITTMIGIEVGDVTVGGTNIALRTNAGLIIFNENGNSTSDVRMEGDTDQNLLFTDASADAVGVGIATPAAKLHIDQASTTAAKPVLTVDQADVSEEFIRFIGSSANGVLTQSVVEAADVTTATIAGYLKIYVQDDGNQLTDQAYYVPIYTLA